MLVLQASKRQELWDHVGFHSDFKGISGNVLQPALKGWCVRLWRWSLSCSGDTSILGMPECGISAKKVSGNELRQPKREATWAENNKAVGVGFPSPLELTQQCHVPRVPDMEL
jgi:hypothetical protein